MLDGRTELIFGITSDGYAEVITSLNQKGKFCMQVMQVIQYYDTVDYALARSRWVLTAELKIVAPGAAPIRELLKNPENDVEDCVTVYLKHPGNGHQPLMWKLASGYWSSLDHLDGAYPRRIIDFPDEVAKIVQDARLPLTCRFINDGIRFMRDEEVVQLDRTYFGFQGMHQLRVMTQNVDESKAFWTGAFQRVGHPLEEDPLATRDELLERLPLLIPTDSVE